MNKLNCNSYQSQYAIILKKLLASPRKKTSSRIGDVHSNFCETFRVDLKKEFPLMDIKWIKFENILHELLWFIKGDTNIKYLIENNCSIWTDDAYRYYKEKYSSYKNETNQLTLELELTKEEFVKKVLNGDSVNIPSNKQDKFVNHNYIFGDLDRVYGFQWRNYNGKTDQLQNCIDTLINNPNDRRMIVVGHNPTDIEENNVGLPSCHNYFQFYTEPISLNERKILGKRLYGEEFNEKKLDSLLIPKYYLNLFTNIRSNDWFLGQPYNMASYALLTLIVGRIVNMIPNELVMNAVDAHLYEKHFDASKIFLERIETIEDSNRLYETGNEKSLSDVTYCKADIQITRTGIKNINDFNIKDFELINYNPQSHIKAPLLT